MGGPPETGKPATNRSKQTSCQSLQLASSCCLGRLHVILATGAEWGWRAPPGDSQILLRSAMGMYHKQKQLSVGITNKYFAAVNIMIVQFFPHAVSRCQHLHYQKKKCALQPWHVNSDLWNSSDRVLLYSTSTPQALLLNIPNVEGM